MDKVREAMIDQDGLVWERIGGAWSLYKPAAQSVPADEDSILAVTNAYESGVGHCNDNLCNPYRTGTAEHIAYDIGKEFGRSRATDVTPSSPPTGVH